MLEYFALWTIGFWAIIGLTTLAFFLAAENQAFGFAGLMAVVATFIFWSSVSWFLTLKFGVVLILIYLGVGIGWSYFRYFLWLKEEIKDKDKTLLKKDIHNAYSLSAVYNKDKIIGWILFWPFSAAWTVTANFRTILFSFVEKSFQRLQEKVVRSYVNEKCN